MGQLRTLAATPVWDARTYAMAVTPPGLAIALNEMQSNRMVCRWGCHRLCNAPVLASRADEVME
jgi:hypothetical protein